MYQSIKQKLTSDNSAKPNYQIEVRAIEARNLISADSNGFSDPYVKFSIRSELAPRKIKHYKTKYIKKNLNPVWNEGFIIPVEDPKTDFLHIEVWDKDFIKSDDPLGYIYFKLDNLEQGKELREWLKLVSVPHGDIFISIKALNFTSHNPQTLNQSTDYDPTHHNLSQPSPFASQPYTNISIDPSTYSQSYLPPQSSFQGLPSAIDPHSYLNQSSLPPYANQPPPMMVVQSQLPPQQQPIIQQQTPLSPIVQSAGESRSHSETLFHTATSQGFDLEYSQIKFLNRIGAGAFGEVWKGEWAGTTVAVKKILKTDISEDDLQEFSHEIILMSKLRHPNIVQFLGACLHPEFCLVTEFMDRGSLFHVLADDKLELKWDVRVQFATDIAKGMLYLHTRTPPIIHRDIKSLNILVTKDWKSTISDFGLTRIKDKTAPDTKVGSPAWSAPEVLRSEEYNEKADVYSYAIVLWEIITRKTPYEELSNPMQLIGQVAYQKPSLRPPIPECPVPSFTKLMVDCWSDNPADRPDFHAIFETLKSISKSLETAE